MIVLLHPPDDDVLGLGVLSQSRTLQGHAFDTLVGDHGLVLVVPQLPVLEIVRILKIHSSLLIGNEIGRLTFSHFQMIK